jgi:hypothetical protein
LCKEPLSARLILSFGNTQLSRTGVQILYYKASSHTLQLIGNHIYWHRCRGCTWYHLLKLGADWYLSSCSYRAGCGSCDAGMEFFRSVISSGCDSIPDLGCAVRAGAVPQDSRRRGRGASSQQRISSDQQLPSAAPRAIEPCPAVSATTADCASDAAIADLLQVSARAIVVVLLMIGLSQSGAGYALHKQAM